MYDVNTLSLKQCNLQLVSPWEIRFRSTNYTYSGSKYILSERSPALAAVHPQTFRYLRSAKFGPAFVLNILSVLLRVPRDVRHGVRRRKRANLSFRPRRWRRRRRELYYYREGVIPACPPPTLPHRWRRRIRPPPTAAHRTRPRVRPGGREGGIRIVG